MSEREAEHHGVGGRDRARGSRWNREARWGGAPLFAVGEGSAACAFGDGARLG